MSEPKISSTVRTFLSLIDPQKDGKLTQAEFEPIEAAYQQLKKREFINEQGRKTDKFHNKWKDMYERPNKSPNPGRPITPDETLWEKVLAAKDSVEHHQEAKINQGVAYDKQKKINIWEDINPEKIKTLIDQADGSLEYFKGFDLNKDGKSDSIPAKVYEDLGPDYQYVLGLNLNDQGLYSPEAAFKGYDYNNDGKADTNKELPAYDSLSTQRQVEMACVLNDKGLYSLSSALNNFEFKKVNLARLTSPQELLDRLYRGLPIDFSDPENKFTSKVRTIEGEKPVVEVTVGKDFYYLFTPDGETIATYQTFNPRYETEEDSPALKLLKLAHLTLDSKKPVSFKDEKGNSLNLTQGLRKMQLEVFIETHIPADGTARATFRKFMENNHFLPLFLIKRQVLNQPYLLNPNDEFEVYNFKTGQFETQVYHLSL